jgi:hypothetical protein
MMNPKAWETINGFTANVKAATERLNKLAVHFPENTQQLNETAARIESECNATMRSLLTEALTGAAAKIAEPQVKAVAQPAKLVIQEAAGRRISRLYLGEMYPKSRQIYLGIDFDDDTQIAIDIDVVSRLSFAIDHLDRDQSGDMEPVEQRIQGSLRSLVPQQSGQPNVSSLEPS